MSVQSHLLSTSSNAILSDTEKSSIDTSISTLQTRISSYFGSDVTTHFRFGSSTRGTILPRSMDSDSDIDYMIVFSDEESKPQTYVSRLKRFAEKYYASSEIAQSHPTVVLKLNHIKFDLVPAIKSYLEEYRIPAPSSSYQDWLATSPNDFNSTLTSANTSWDYKLKPCIRLLKYWNARVGYVFDSYSLEKWAAGRYYISCSTVRDYFFSLVDDLSLDWNAAQWRKDKVDRAKAIVANTREYERKDMPASAEQEIKKLIP
jgi:predicted nucleotidyltransferase